MSEEAALKQTDLCKPFRTGVGKDTLSTARQKLARIAVLYLALSAPVVAFAQQFIIENASTIIVNQVYTLNASLKYHFSEESLAALKNGISLYLVLDIEVIKPRRYMWDEEIATLEQRYEIRYLALTNQYLLANTNSGSQHVYHSLDDALETLEHIESLPIIDAHLLNNGDHYMVQVRSRLDLDSLPVPLRLKAYFSSDWWLTSGWYSWDL